MRISDWSSDVCSSDLPASATVLIASGPDSRLGPERSENLTLSAQLTPARGLEFTAAWFGIDYSDRVAAPAASLVGVLDNPLYADLATRSEEHTSELQSLMRISYDVFCYKKKTNHSRSQTRQDIQIQHIY